MAFFRERGFSGTRSNLWARFSGEPPSLSEIRSFLKATFWAQGSHSEPKSLSKEIDSTVRAKDLSQYPSNDVDLSRELI
jgi:hypothetical protein